MILINSLGLSHDYARRAVRPGDTVVDATCGKGRDTLFLAGLVGECGKVFAFDIQSESVELTRSLLENHKINNTVVFNENHEKIDEFVLGGVSCIMFNLGFLPGSDHLVQTKGENTIKAIVKFMDLIKAGGIITVVIYQGGDTGYMERDLVLDFCTKVNQKEFTVMKTSFENQKNNPPIFICIEKL